MKMHKNSQWLYPAELVFKVLLFGYAALGTCNLTYGKSIISWVMYAAFLLGAVLVLIRLLNLSVYCSMPGMICASLLWCSHAISLIANFHYLNKTGLVYFILWTFYFFILYTQPADRQWRIMKNEFRVMTVFFAVWNTILLVISMYMLLTGYGSVYRDENNALYEVASGVFAGRLWGAYQDPNLGSVMGCVNVALCGYWFVRRKHILLRGLLIADVALILFYMAMSDSRNGMVCLGVLLAVTFAMCWFGHPKKPVGSIPLGLVIIMVLLMTGLAIPKVIQNGYNNYVISQFARQSEETLTGTTVQIQDPQETAETVATETVPETKPAAEDNQLSVIDRGYDMSGDISNRRFTLWKSGIELALCKPLTGLSFTGVKPYAREYLPDTFIVADESWSFNTFDNELINIFVSMGIPGLTAVLAWFVLAVIWVFGRIRATAEEELPEVFTMTAVLCILITSALFQGTMFFQTTPNTVVFWLVFGYLAILLSRKGNSQDMIFG